MPHCENKGKYAKVGGKNPPPLHIIDISSLKKTTTETPKTPPLEVGVVSMDRRGRVRKSTKYVKVKGKRRSKKKGKITPKRISPKTPPLEVGVVSMDHRGRVKKPKTYVKVAKAKRSKRKGRITPKRISLRKRTTPPGKKTTETRQ